MLSPPPLVNASYWLGTRPEPWWHLKPQSLRRKRSRVSCFTNHLLLFRARFVEMRSVEHKRPSRANSPDVQ